MTRRHINLVQPRSQDGHPSSPRSRFIARKHTVQQCFIHDAMGFVQPQHLNIRPGMIRRACPGHRLGKHLVGGPAMQLRACAPQFPQVRFEQIGQQFRDVHR